MRDAVIPPVDEDHLHRLFVAVALPPESCLAVAELVGRVRSSVEGSGREVRWVRLDGLHLTLRFLGATAPERIPGIEAAVRAAALRAHGFDIRIGGAGAFPAPGRPRVLWLGVIDGQAELAALAAELGRELAADGWPVDHRPFQAHLTLARADGVRAGPRTAGALLSAAQGFSTAWRAGSLALFESHTGGGPARYERLLEVAFPT